MGLVAACVLQLCVRVRTQHGTSPRMAKDNIKCTSAVTNAVRASVLCRKKTAQNQQPQATNASCISSYCFFAYRALLNRDEPKLYKARGLPPTAGT